jgi:large subunit ribosomal protein L30
MALKIKVTQVRSGVGRPQKHRLVLKGLGLKRMNQSVVLQDTPAIRGMIRKIPHLVNVEAVE